VEKIHGLGIEFYRHHFTQQPILRSKISIISCEIAIGAYKLKPTPYENRILINLLKMEEVCGQNIDNPLSEAMDLRINRDMQCPKINSDPVVPRGSYNPAPDDRQQRCDSVNSRDGKKRRNVNIFKKHKLKYRYLLNKNKQASDSGNFGSSSMQGSSSTTSMGESQKTSTNNESTSSPCTSSSPSSGDSHSPDNFNNNISMGTMPNDPSMCVMLGNAVPLVVMMQGQLQSGNRDTNGMYNMNNMNSSTTLYKCNMCSMFSNNLTDVLNHVNSNHANIHYCFVCNRFHSNKQEYNKHKDVCTTAHQAFQQIMDGYSNNQQGHNHSKTTHQEQALNLSVAGNVAMRAAQIVHSKKGRKNKIKKLQKCTYCKKAFFGRFYLQRHLRSHTGEKLCHCNICGKGFAEWRNLRNHMSRFHNSSESNSSGGGKSVSPNLTSDSDPVNNSRPIRRGSTKEKTKDNPMMTSQNHPPKHSMNGNGGGNASSGANSTSVNASNVDTSSNNGNRLPYSESAFKRAPGNALPPSSKLYPIDVAAWSSGSVQYPNTTYNALYTSSGYSDTTLSAPVYSANTTAATPQQIDVNVHPISNDAASTVVVSSSPISYPVPHSTQSDRPQSSENNMPASNVSMSVTSCEELKPMAYLGSTSSRLELSTGLQGHEQSLNPVCNENGEKIFKCHMCNKEFRTKFAMQRHLDFHADKRPYECTQCDYKAKTKPQLKVHVMRHSGEKCFTCSICNYSCVTHSDLNRHCKSRSHLFRVNLLEQKDGKAESDCTTKSDPQTHAATNLIQ